MICKGRVAIVTGAGRGLGRAHAIELAKQGAQVVVNDLGVAADGSGKSSGPAQEVVDEIKAFGGEAIANADDIADWNGAKSLIDAAVKAFGRLDALVNNAGFVRDRMFVSATEDEWDAVIRVHMKGHFATAKHAVDHWRARTKAGEKIDARIINTTSGAGLQGSIGQSAYSAAKAGITALTLVQAAELGRYGITANAIAPAARTRMTEQVFAQMMQKPDGGFDKMAPENVSPVVAWLASESSKAVTGQVFEVAGGKIAIAEGWHEGPFVERDSRFQSSEVGSAVADLLGRARAAQKVYGT